MRHRRRKTKKIVNERAPLIGPTLEREARGSLITVPLDDAGVFTRVAQAPLERYNSRGELTRRQYRAGTVLREDYEIGIIGVRGGEGYVLGTVGSFAGRAGYAEYRLAAIERYQGAVAVIDRLVFPVVMGVCCEERPVKELATNRSTRDKFMIYLRTGLDQLANHYGWPRD